MKKLRWGQGAFGELKVFNTVALAVLLAFNIINSISEGYDVKAVVVTILTVAIALTISLLSVYKNALLIALYLYIAIILAIYPSNISDFSASIFFVFSFNITKSKKIGVGILSISLVLVLIRSIIFEDTMAGSFMMLAAYSVVYITHYYLMLKNHFKRRVDVWNGISEKEKAILKLYMRGYDYAKISRTLNLTDKKESIRTIITRVRIKSECENDIQFGIWLSEKG